eukprot:SAG31_NODE_29524_length_394_cov_0.433898_1_plen_44_part_10
MVQHGKEQEVTVSIVTESGLMHQNLLVIRHDIVPTAVAHDFCVP